MDGFFGEIRIFGFNYAPQDWAYCTGQTVGISQYNILYAVIGTLYGGDGKTNFKLPNLQGSAPMGIGAGPGLTPRTIGQVVGEETVLLTTTTVPPHNHGVQATVNIGTNTAPDATMYLATRGKSPNMLQMYTPYTTPPANTLVNMSPKMVNVVGGSSAHDNRQPYLVMNFCINTYGAIFPVRQ